MPPKLTFCRTLRVSKTSDLCFAVFVALCIFDERVDFLPKNEFNFDLAPRTYGCPRTMSDNCCLARNLGLSRVHALKQQRRAHTIPLSFLLCLHATNCLFLLLDWIHLGGRTMILADFIPGWMDSTQTITSTSRILHIRQ